MTITIKPVLVVAITILGAGILVGSVRPASAEDLVPAHKEMRMMADPNRHDEFCVSIEKEVFVDERGIILTTELAAFPSADNGQHVSGAPCPAPQEIMTTMKACPPDAWLPTVRQDQRCMKECPNGNGPCDKVGAGGTTGKPASCSSWTCAFWPFLRLGGGPLPTKPDFQDGVWNTSLRSAGPTPATSASPSTGSPQ